MDFWRDSQLVPSGESGIEDIPPSLTLASSTLSQLSVGFNFSFVWEVSESGAVVFPLCLNWIGEKVSN